MGISEFERSCLNRKCSLCANFSCDKKIKIFIYIFRSEYGAFWKCVTAGAIYMITQLAKMIFLATVFPVPLDEDDDDPNAEIPFDFLMVRATFFSNNFDSTLDFQVIN